MKLRKLLLAGGALAALAGVPAQASIVDNPHFKVLGLVIVWGADSLGAAPIASDFVIDTGSGATAAASGDADLIGADVHTVVTGSLTATPTSLAGSTPFDVTGATTGGGTTDSNSDGVLDAADTFGAFGLDSTTDVDLAGAAVSNSSFYVASNTAFAIDAQAVVVGTATNFTLADVGYAMSVTQSGTDSTLAFGGNSQFPHSGGATSGVSSAVTDLGDLSTAANVFTGNRRTAATAGSIVDQSVRFDVVYSLGGGTGYDLSMGAGEIEADVTYTVFVP